MTQTDTLIIGGGLAGVASLYELTARGVPAMLLEASSELAEAGASFANGAMLTPSQSDPWNSPGIGGHLVASLFDPAAPVRLHATQIPNLALWGLEFIRNSTPARHRAITEANYRLASASLSRTEAIAREIGYAFEGGGRGTMKLFSSEAAMRGPLALARHLTPLGLEFEVLGADKIADVDPALAEGAERLAGALHFPTDRFGDARRFTLAWAEAAQRRGAVVRLSAPVDSLQRNGSGFVARVGEDAIEAARVVIATGVDAPRLARTFGVRLPIRPAKGYSVTLDMTGLNARPTVAVVDDARHIASTPLGDRLRVVGMAEFIGRDRRLDPQRLDLLFDTVRGLYPSLAERLDPRTANTWTGLRPMSADGRPFIGETDVPGLWINAGHGHLGWTKAAGSAQLLADLMTGKAPGVPAAPFAVRGRRLTH